jgi:hypothetical protein
MRIRFGGPSNPKDHPPPLEQVAYSTHACLAAVAHAIASLPSRVSVSY